MKVPKVLALFAIQSIQVSVAEFSRCVGNKPSENQPMLADLLAKKIFTKTFWDSIALPEIDDQETQLYDGTFIGSNSVTLLRLNIFAPKRSPMFLQITAAVNPMHVGYNGKTSFIFVKPHFRIEVYIPTIKISVDTDVSHSGIEVRKFEVEINDLDIDFEFVGVGALIPNLFRTIIGSLIKNSLSAFIRTELVRLGKLKLQEILRKHIIGTLETEECARVQCTPFEALLWQTVQDSNIDPAYLPPSSVGDLSNPVKVLGTAQVTNGSVHGLKGTRQSTLVSINVYPDCGLVLYVHLRFPSIALNLIITLHTFLVDITVSSKVTLSGRVAVSILERNATAILSRLEVKSVKLIGSSVEAIGGLSSRLHYLLPGKTIIAKTIINNIDSLLNAAIQGLLDNINNYAHAR